MPYRARAPLASHLVRTRPFAARDIWRRLAPIAAIAFVAQGDASGAIRNTGCLSVSNGFWEEERMWAAARGRSESKQGAQMYVTYWTLHVTGVVDAGAAVEVVGVGIMVPTHCKR